MSRFAVLFAVLLCAACVLAVNEQQQWLEDNKSKEGVVVLPSGLQYKVLKSGPSDGPLAQKSNKVECHYRGKTIDGQEFDSSYSRGKPAVFGVTQVIKGWTEALQLMRPGDHWELYIPSDLAYGSRGAGGKIKPGATLIFELEVVAIH